MADVVMKRAYAYGGTAHDKSWVISILSKCQRVINAFTGSVESSADLTVLKEKLVYTLRNELAECLEVTKATESRAGVDHELARVYTPEELAAYDIDWFRKIDGDRYDAWIQIGRDLLIIYPSKAANGTVTVYYTKLTDALVIDTDEFDLADEDVSPVLDLAELVLLARDKQIVPGAEKAGQLAARLGLELSDD